MTPHSWDPILEMQQHSSSDRRNATMRIKLSHITLLFVAGAAMAATVAAPTAVAIPTPLHKNCVASGAATTCQSPGNVEVTDTPPSVSFHPYGNMPYLLGG
jgi:hypothetical protein